MKFSKREKRINRHRRVRAKVIGTKGIPRVSVFRSNRHISVQVFDDQTGKTLASAGDFANQAKKANKTDRAETVGAILAEKIKAAGIEKVVFDRAGYKYHGRVKALAEALRKGGIRF